VSDEIHEMTERPGQPYLYVVHLGGELVPGRMGEDHEVVIVTAAEPAEARSKAKAKWQGTGKAHIDALQRIDRVDGYDVILQPGRGDDLIAIDQTYEPADPD
jgi:Domain of Unknown Function (DUF1543)